MRAALAVAIALVISGPAAGGQAPQAGPPGTFVETQHPMLVAEAPPAPTSTFPRPPPTKFPPTSQRAAVPRTAGTGLSGVPVGGGTTVMGLSPGVATLLGIVIVGGIVAIIVNGNNNDAPAPIRTGSGSGGG